MKKLIFLFLSVIAAGSLFQACDNSKTYAEIGNRFPGIDLAILENGQYNEEWSLIHLMPQYMAQTARDLKAKRVLTVHHSKYALAKHRWDEPLKNAEEMKNKDSLNVLIPEIGEVVALEK